MANLETDAFYGWLEECPVDWWLLESDEEFVNLRFKVEDDEDA